MKWADWIERNPAKKSEEQPKRFIHVSRSRVDAESACDETTEVVEHDGMYYVVTKDRVGQLD